ncbi:hypothetical protein ROLI_006240 [Roseobacter fucihabitans]|uniref:Uncharacterized protein n=1 Tax=Roseobacter fucihabitans TaxID=1537242 RepID=A0ABZ2BNI0_9RHOB|nr:hypothetical protein [Roseobacter litoralis]MBC6966243.1 hypothetical protein [Roseobacter litoralis]
MIDETHPNWETFHDTLESKRLLSQQRQELIDYQSKLDHAQTLIDQGGLTDDDFAELDDLMTNDVPDAVRSRLPASDPAYSAPVNTGSPSSNGVEYDGPEFAGLNPSRIGLN